MSNKVALIVAVLICAAFAYDGLQKDWTTTVFLARKGLSLIDWLQFWR